MSAESLLPWWREGGAIATQDIRDIATIAGVYSCAFKDTVDFNRPFVGAESAWPASM